MKKVYICNRDNKTYGTRGFNFKDKEKSGDYQAIKEHAEIFDRVYTLEEFQNIFNNEEITISNSFIFIDK